MQQGLIVETLSPGNGIKPQKGQKVQVHYRGYLVGGKLFDKSDKDAGPFQFVLGANKVIKGWEEGIKQMSKGEKAKITCPPEYGYGKKGTQGIPPNSTLIFEVELVDFK